MAYSKIGFTKGQKLKAEHMNHIEEGISNIAFDDLKERPFGEIVCGDTYDFAVIPDVTFDAFGMVCYKFSDLMPTYDQLLSAVFTETGLMDGATQTNTQTPVESDFLEVGDKLVAFTLNFGAYVVAYEAGTIETNLAGAVTVPEAGLYFAWESGSSPTDVEAKVTVEYREVKKIDEKYLPETTGGGGSDLPTVTTDDNGKLLQVVDGTWAAVAITDGNNVAY